MSLIADQRRGDGRERRGQARRLQRLGPGRLERPPRLDEALAGEPRGVVDVAGAFLGSVGGRLGRLELGDDAGQPVGDRVVDLAGHPLALVEDAGLAGLLDELAMELGVLVQGGLEPDDGLAARPRSNSASRSPITPPKPIAIVWMMMTAGNRIQSSGVGHGNPVASRWIRHRRQEDAEDHRAATAGAASRGRSP